MCIHVCVLLKKKEEFITCNPTKVQTTTYEYSVIGKIIKNI